MKLKVKFLKWEAGLPVAMLHFKTAEKLGVRIQGNISIKTLSKYSKEMVTIIDTIDEPYVRENEILVSNEIKEEMRLKKGQKVDVNLAPIPESLNFIKKKLNSGVLTRNEIFIITRDIARNALSEAEIALLVAAMYKQGMRMSETIAMIEAMIKFGNKFSVKGKYIVDKHSIGGVAGNRTTPIVVSICSADGLIFPKTSSRAITSAAGTADVLETIMEVEFTPDELKKILKKTNAFMVWGGSLDMVPVDSKIIKVEKELNIDPKSQLVASIMSKKFAVGSKYILIDIPYGKSVKVDRKKAESLKNEFLSLGKHFHKKIRVVLTDGSEPIGNGVGPALELKDIVKVLDPKQKGPKDLEKKSLFLAGELFELTGMAKKGYGLKMAEKILYSGDAFKKFKEIVEAQKGNLNRLKRVARFKKEIHSAKKARITGIDNKKINSLARITGCPVDKFSGVYLYHHVGDEIKKGEKIISLYSETQSRLRQAIKFYRVENPIKFK
ncbi:thymidine phosphorylase [Candidatus Pacearchaeota archaeon]|nr:thymidine phosphorylase [Candidatus Pacearchaeota archaeon]